MEETKEQIIHEHYLSIGKMGGEATFKKYGIKHIKKISKAGVEARKKLSKIK